MSDTHGAKRLRNVDRALSALATTPVTLNGFDRLVLLVVACAPEASTPLISEMTGLTPRVVDTITARLVEHGLLLRL